MANSRDRKRSDAVKRAPALSIESRQDQLIALATQLAQKQLAQGTASSAVIVHYLKLGTTKQQLEKQKLRKENELLRAKTESLKSARRVQELYINALNAMKSYRSSDSQVQEQYQDEDKDIF